MGQTSEQTRLEEAGYTFEIIRYDEAAPLRGRSRRVFVATVGYAGKLLGNRTEYSRTRARQTPTSWARKCRAPSASDCATAKANSP